MLYRGVTKFTTLLPTLSPYYLVKLISHKDCISKLVVTVFCYSIEEWVSVWDKWTVFTRDSRNCYSAS